MDKQELLRAANAKIKEWILGLRSGKYNCKIGAVRYVDKI